MDDIFWSLEDGLRDRNMSSMLKVYI